MLISTEAEVILSSKSIEYYETLGYKIPRYVAPNGKLKVKRGTKIKVRVEDLQKNSLAEVDCLCDYCLEKNINTVISKPFVRYTLCNTNGVIHKDCCSKCNILKLKESNMISYGVVNISKVPTVNNKIKETMISKFGVDNPFKCEYIQEQIRKTKLKKFGYDNYTKTKKFKTYITGKNNSNWKGGITSLTRYLRGKINPWINDSLKEYDYKCIMTGEITNIVVHHVNKNFNNILLETLDKLKLNTREKISDYSEKELGLLTNEILKLHYLYGLGIPLKDVIHVDFHKKYGYKNNNKKQFEDYKKYYNEREAI